MYIVLLSVLSLVLLVVAVLIVAARRPANFRVVRTQAISAPAAEIFPHVNNLAQWASWSPWEKVDPGMQRSFDGPNAGVGAGYAWKGNKKIGEGSMTIMESRPVEFIRIKLEFIKPMPGICEVMFTFQPQHGQTVVTWSMGGCHSFMARFIGVFINLDKMTGGYFEQGLADLKRVVEKG